MTWDALKEDLKLGILLRLSGEIFVKSPSVRKELLKSIERDIRRKLKVMGWRADLELLDNRYFLAVDFTNLKDILKLLVLQPGVSSVSPSILITGAKKRRDLRALLSQLLPRFITYYKPHSIRIFWERLPSSEREELISLKEEVLRSSLRLQLNPTTDPPRELDMRLEHRDRYFLLIFREPSLKAMGGLPLLSDSGEEEVGVLLSEGPDSLLAALLLIRRGVRITPIHFAMGEVISPYLRESLAILKLIQPSMRYLVLKNWDEVLRKLATSGPKRELCLRCKASMMRISAELMREVTGESRVVVATGEILGEQASQTLSAMTSTWQGEKDVVILKPLVGFTKDEVYQYLKRFGLYDLVISRGHSRCPFVPDKPRTKSPRYQEGLSLEEARSLGLARVEVKLLPHKTILEKLTLPSHQVGEALSLLYSLLSERSP